MHSLMVCMDQKDSGSPRSSHPSSVPVSIWHRTLTLTDGLPLGMGSEAVQNTDWIPILPPIAILGHRARSRGLGFRQKQTSLLGWPLCFCYFLGLRFPHAPLPVLS